MNSRMIILSLFISQVTLAQTNLSDPSRKPAITAIGKPVGNIISTKIGSKGGSLISADGKLEIKFPEGALDNETLISIQSLNNTITETDDGAYQLEPSGIRFKRPVRLVFHYSDDNHVKLIATQDEKGEWLQLKKIAIDSVKKTVSGLIPHFSRWAVASRFVLKPRKATVETSGSAKLYIVEYPPPIENPEDIVSLEEIKINGQSSDAEFLEDLIQIELTEVKINGSETNNEFLQPLEKKEEDLVSLKHKYEVLNWTVNGIQNGNSEVGTVSGNESAIYNAPVTVPFQNPVAVSVKIKIKLAKGATRIVSLISNIKIIPNRYHFTYIHIDENGCYFLVDSSSCIITIQGNKATLSEIKNHKPWSDWPNCDKCRWDWTNKETLLGLTQINAMANSSVTPLGDAKGSVRVFVMLTPAFGNTPSAVVHCPKNPPRTMPSFPMPADPKYISFDVDGNDITIHYAGRSGKNELVLPAKNEKTMLYVYKL